MDGQILSELKFFLFIFFEFQRFFQDFSQKKYEKLISAGFCLNLNFIFWVLLKFRPVSPLKKSGSPILIIIWLILNGIVACDPLHTNGVDQFKLRS